MRVRAGGQGRGRFVSRPDKRVDHRTRKTVAADGTRRGARGRQRHSLTALRRLVAALGPRSLDRVLDARTRTGQALLGWRRDLITDLGGPEAVATAQVALVEVAVRTRLLLDSADAFILTMPSVVNRRRRVLFPVVIQRQGLVRELTHTLSLLGLERRPPRPLDLGEYLARR